MKLFYGLEGRCPPLKWRRQASRVRRQAISTEERRTVGGNISDQGAPGALGVLGKGEWRAGGDNETQIVDFRTDTKRYKHGSCPSMDRAPGHGRPGGRRIRPGYELKLNLRSRRWTASSMTPVTAAALRAPGGARGLLNSARSRGSCGCQYPHAKPVLARLEVKLASSQRDGNAIEEATQRTRGRPTVRDQRPVRGRRLRAGSRHTMDSIMADGRSTTVALPRGSPHFAVLPGKGGLTRLVEQAEGSPGRAT